MNNENKRVCEDFGICGGCEYQDIPYERELALKEGSVLALLEDAGITGFGYLGIESGSAQGYRNKMEFSFGDGGKGSELMLGIRKRASFYEVVPPVNCNIVCSDFRKIAAATQAFFRRAGERFYHKRAKLGALRHLVVRRAHFTGEVLVNLVTTSAIAADTLAFAAELCRLALDGKIVGILHTINDSVADAVKCDKLDILYGQDFFTERLLGLTFKISAFSFFQTNSEGAERLYSIVREFAGDLDNKSALDLYCGTGTIAQVLASGAATSKIYREAKTFASAITQHRHMFSAFGITGIELVEEAVESARANAALNGLNCEFIPGDVQQLIEGIGYRPDVIVLDPPREGVHPKALPKILSLRAERIIYVSCKPLSLARDLPIFVESGYHVNKLVIYDMFPRTAHVETVVLLQRHDT